MRCSITGWRGRALPGTITYLAGLRGNLLIGGRALLPLAQLHRARRVADAGGHAQHARACRTARSGRTRPPSCPWLPGCRSARGRGCARTRAKVRLSCSFWLECIAGSSAETMTSPASMPVIDAYMNASAATFSPTCFMAAKRAAARIGRADRDVQRHLFVGRPLGVDVGETGEFFEDFGAGGPRIGGGDGHAGLPCAARYGLVAGEQSDHFVNLHRYVGTVKTWQNAHSATRLEPRAGP